MWNFAANNPFSKESSHDSCFKIVSKLPLLITIESLTCIWECLKALVLARCSFPIKILSDLNNFFRLQRDHEFFRIELT